MGNELLTGFLAGQSDNNSNGNNGGGFFGNEGLWAVIILAIIFGWGNGNGLGGRNGGSNGGDNVTVVPYPAPGYGMGFGGGYPTEAVLQRALDTQTIISKLDGNTQGLCDGFYAQSNAINGLGATIMQGFNGVDRVVCQQGYQTQAGFNALGNQISSCCCDIKSAIGDVKYQMAADTCAIQNIIQTTTRDVIDNQNANYRGLMDFMVQSKIDALQAENQNLKLAASQANQNAAIGAMISASEATILRRTGAECPTAAYVVQPPTPVNFPVNQCGQFSGWNNGCDCGGNRCC